MKEIIETEYKSPTQIEVTYSDGTVDLLDVQVVGTRATAILLCCAKTKEYLKKEEAFEKLHNLRNDFSRLRNYEIEEYLLFVTSKYHGINEMCPFNGFKYFGG